MSKEQNQSWNLLEPKSFDTYMNVAVPMIVMLDHSKIDIETLDVDIEITEFNDCRKMLEDNWDTNDILAVIQKKAKFSAKIVGNLSTHLCCGNHLSQEQMITQGVNLLVEVSSGEFTRELDKESLLN